MPPIETAFRKQKATYWPKAGVDDYGQAIVGDPIEINVRWVYGKRSTLDADGNTVTLDAQVVVDREVEIGGTMWLGQLAEWTGTGSAGDDDEVMEIVTFDRTPDLKARNIRRMVGLRKFRDALPGTEADL